MTTLITLLTALTPLLGLYLTCQITDFIKTETSSYGI